MMTEEENNNLVRIAKDAALDAINQSTCSSGTFVSTYRTPVSQMIEIALISALKAFKMQADAREKILLDKIDMLSKKVNTNMDINGARSWREVLVGKTNECKEQRQQLTSLISRQM